ncbi:MAG: hypothetical protein LBC29_01710 [Propionibacteriaceae bacterium]|nr:hypothetical protein [Propionibacteriaceae bacterium]
MSTPFPLQRTHATYLYVSSRRKKTNIRSLPDLRQQRVLRVTYPPLFRRN